MATISPDTVSERLARDDLEFRVPDIPHADASEEWRIPDSDHIDVYEEVQDTSGAAAETLKQRPEVEEVVTVCGEVSMSDDGSEH